jgi:hypothetical protein
MAALSSFLVAVPAAPAAARWSKPVTVPASRYKALVGVLGPRAGS